MVSVKDYKLTDIIFIIGGYFYEKVHKKLIDMRFLKFIKTNVLLIRIENYFSDIFEYFCISLDNKNIHGNIGYTDNPE